MLELLYTSFITPLELIFEGVYALAYRITGHPVIAIVCLSLVVNLMALPFYIRADAIQEEEKSIQSKMKKWTDHIRKHFKGDERYMILQEYYRMNHYKPWYSLRSSFSILLQIPFFIAAYHFLSNLGAIRGVSFWLINDMGLPDGILLIAGHHINVLPVLMTLINVISASLYSNNSTIRQKVQLYVTALVFLVLLYDSPAGLVLYWTLNNIFSLIKNIFYKLKNPGKVISILLSPVGLALLVSAVTVIKVTPRQKILLIALAVLMQMPVVFCLISGRKGLNPNKSGFELPAVTLPLRLSCIAFLTVLSGVLIPSALISASVSDFIMYNHPVNQVVYVRHVFFIAIGYFVLWRGLFRSLANDLWKKIIDILMVLMCFGAAIDYMCFGLDLGTISNLLVLDSDLVYSSKEMIKNGVILSAVFVLILFLLKKKQVIVSTLVLSALAAGIVMSSKNIRIMNTEFTSAYKIITSQDRKAEIPLSKKGKNVIVLMIDRAINNYVPYIFEEKPELREKFSGFTFYENCTSFGGSTNIGTPPLFGGYDYTPEEMNARSDESLCDKQNEALKVLPAIFGRNDYTVTVCDPPYAGYKIIPDLSIFDNEKNVSAYVTKGHFLTDEQIDGIEKRFKRNLFCYSLFKMVPVALQNTVYDMGLYNMPLSEDALVQKVYGISKAYGIKKTFMDAYEVLQHLPELCDIREDGGNNLLMLSNITPHEMTLLKEPEYEPAVNIDNSEYDLKYHSKNETGEGINSLSNDNDMRHYHVNMATYIQLGEWFDFLRGNDLYDNSRIIIVSDHGWGVNDDGRCQNVFQCVLMEKDFNASGFNIDESFMTNADVPYLAARDIIDDPVNPFTGNPLDGSDKKDSITVFNCSQWNPVLSSGNTFAPGDWYTVHDDVHIWDNWEHVGWH